MVFSSCYLSQLSSIHVNIGNTFWKDASMDFLNQDLIQRLFKPLIQGFSNSSIEVLNNPRFFQ